MEETHHMKTGIELSNPLISRP